MRVSQAEKEKSHQRILDSAARLIRERGIEGAGVADVMKDAGMTPGGFYRHFSSKDDLVGAALEAAFAQSLDRLVEADDPAHAAEAVAEFERFYLSATHVDNPGYGCPIPALAGELERSATLKTPMTSGVEAMIDRLAAGLTGPPAERRSEAAAHIAMIAGAVMIARASEPAVGQFVLDAVRNQLGLNAGAWSTRRTTTTQRGDRP